VNTSIGRSGVRRAVLLAASAVAVTATASCSSSPAEQAAASSSAALSSAAEAAPGTYGQPVDPSLPEPPSVASDAPVTVAPTAEDDVFLTYSEWNATTGAIEVGGYLDGVVESDGTCTLTGTKDGTSAQSTAPGISDATSTSCAGLSLPGDQLSPGTWSVMVTYESGTSRGTSAPVEVEVP
jgi:hypothetical protein